MNCWEFWKCGREPGGARADELGVCRAATFTAADEFCGGTNGGRACAFVTGTLCTGRIQGTRKEKKKYCSNCDFYRLLREEHGNEQSDRAFTKHVLNKELLPYCRIIHTGTDSMNTCSE